MLRLEIIFPTEYSTASLCLTRLLVYKQKENLSPSRDYTLERSPPCMTVHYRRLHFSFSLTLFWARIRLRFHCSIVLNIIICASCGTFLHCLMLFPYCFYLVSFLAHDEKSRRLIYSRS